MLYLLDEEAPVGTPGAHDIPVLRLLDVGDDPAALARTGTGPATAQPTTSEGAVASGVDRAEAGGTGTARHQVVPGDNLWAIAETVVAAGDGREPDQRTIAEYWLRLIERNRVNLADPDDPDLLFCGQWLDLPDRSPDR